MRVELIHKQKVYLAVMDAVPREGEEVTFRLDDKVTELEVSAVRWSMEIVDMPQDELGCTPVLPYAIQVYLRDPNEGYRI